MREKIGSKSGIGNVCSAMEGRCCQGIKIVHHHANTRVDWLISQYQSVKSSREAISILSGKYKNLPLSTLYMYPSMHKS